MESNDYCDIEGCISPATAFYFKADSVKKRVCDQHLPTDVEKHFEIAQLKLITSPEDEDLYLARLEEVRRGKDYLKNVFSKATSEHEQAIKDLDTGMKRAVKIVQDIYTAERRRTEQHFTQVEVFLKDFDDQLALYLTSKERSLSDVMKKVVKEELVPCVLRARTFNNDLELAQIIMKSCSRGELSLDKHLTAFLNPVTQKLIATKLYQQAQESAETKDFIELQRALANCQESLLMVDKPEVAKLASEIEARILTQNKERDTEMVEFLTHDAASIKSLLQICLENIQNTRDSQEIKNLYKKAKLILLPLSQSMTAVDLLIRSGFWNSQKENSAYSEAEENYQTALQILERHFPTLLETGKTYFNLGELSIRLDKFDEAEARFQAALNIFSTNFPTSIDIVKTFVSLGEVYRKMNRFDETEDSLQRALDILVRYFPNSWETAATWINLGEFHQALNRCNKAEECLQEALTVLKPNFPISLELAKTYINLGVLFRLSNRPDSAEEYLHAALSILTPNFPDSFMTAKTLMNLGSLYEISGRYDEVESLYQRALDIYVRFFPNSIQNVTALYCLGNIYVSSNRFDKAERCFLDAVNSVTLYFPDSDQKGIIYLKLGELQETMKKYKEAEKHLNEALSYFTSKNEREKSMAPLFLLMKIYARTGNMNKASQLIIRFPDLTSELASTLYLKSN